MNEQQTKLTADDVRIIRDCYDEYKRLKRQVDELSPTSLARKFGVSKATLQKVCERVTWKYLWGVGCERWKQAVRVAHRPWLTC